MQFGIFLLTLIAYGLAFFLWYRERTPNYVIGLLAGHLFSLASPLWQMLYRFSYNSQWAPLYTAFGHMLPRLTFVAAWTFMIPPLLIFFLYRNRWWEPSYLIGLLTFALFVVYYLIIESFGLRSDWWQYSDVGTLPLGMQVTLLSALMNGLVALGSLSILIMTRRYAWLSLLLLLLPMPLILSLFVNGLLGAPLYTVFLLREQLQAQSWPGVIGMIGTLGLLFWGAHIVASAFEGQRAERGVV
ncbi:MAG TPA: hypothetical protein VFT66_22605 [Roseiflexaceae bacterium]|jgi:hypothetical protein|nr:hypothetical protein [Roseiflexaceae bacterium]